MRAPSRAVRSGHLPSSVAGTDLPALNTKGFNFRVFALIRRQVARLMAADLAQVVTLLAQRARAASFALATASTDSKNRALEEIAERLTASTEILLAANQRDLAAAVANGLAAAQIDRLTLNPARLLQLAESVRQVALLPDPVGEL